MRGNSVEKQKMKPGKGEIPKDRVSDRELEDRGIALRGKIDLLRC